MSIEYDFKYERQMIGKLIYFYRKQMKIKVESFLCNKGDYYNSYCLDCNKCENPESICSLGTLYKIEKGENVAKRDCIYHRLCENLNLKFNFDEKMLNRIKQYQDLLYNTLIDFSKDNLKKIASKLEQDRNVYNDCIYIYEILSLYLHLINYILYKKIPCNQSIDLYIYLKDCVCEEDKKFILLLLFNLSKDFVSDKLDRKEVINECTPYFEDKLFYDVQLSGVVDNNYIEAYTVLENEEKRDDLTDYQRLTLLKYKGFIYLNSGSFDNSYNSFLKCLEILNNSNLSDLELYDCYRRLGIVTFVLGKYSESIDYYKRIIDANLTLGINYCLFFHAMEIENRKDEIVDIISKIDFVSSVRNAKEKIVLDYYRDKYLFGELTKERIQLLEKIICYNIKPIFDTMGSLQKRVFISDLKDYVKFTGNYKCLYEVTNIVYDNVEE